MAAASEARIWKENARVGMRDRVRGLEEVKCQIGIQNGGIMGMTDRPLLHPSQSTRRFPSKVSPKISAPIMEYLNDARSGVSRSGPSDGRPGRWKDIEEVSKRLR